MKKDIAFQNYIEKRAKVVIARLKPKIKEQVVFKFDDHTIIVKSDISGFLINAEFNNGFNPPIITIHLGSIERMWKSFLQDNLVELIKHELTHYFVGEDETKVAEKEHKMNFFND